MQRQLPALRQVLQTSTSFHISCWTPPRSRRPPIFRRGTIQPLRDDEGYAKEGSSFFVGEPVRKRKIFMVVTLSFDTKI
jgi:hypothetical protein